MANLWQLLICITCSLTLKSVFAFGKDRKPDSTSVSYSPNASPLNRLERQAYIDSKRLTDLATAATSASSLASSGYAQQLQQYHHQPSIYHSIIDRTIPAASQPASPVQATTSAVADLSTAAGHHHGHAHGKYYEYREVPKKKTWKFGYKRGNHKHTIERHEHGKAGKHPHFKTKVKWHDKKSKGKGIHLWDYNHHKKHHHYG